MELDFLLFQLKLLHGLTPHVSLQDNLRAVIAPTLSKLRRASGAPMALHIFANPELKESHVMIVGQSRKTADALRQELSRRHEGSRNMGPTPGLPGYTRVKWESGNKMVFKEPWEGPEYLAQINGASLEFLKQVAAIAPEDFGAHEPKIRDSIIVIPLANRAYPRLGHFVLWAPGNRLEEYFSDAVKREDRVLFCKSIIEMIIRVFSNFYGMEPHTYLPSYHLMGIKPVTILCAEICGFDEISESIHRRFSPQDRQDKLRSLVDWFVTTVSAIIESDYHRGRVDQIWGSGLVAVFGEYLDTPDWSPGPACMRALSAGAEITRKISEGATPWLNQALNLPEFVRSNPEDVSIGPAVAIHHGEVTFDYVGSPDHRVYMAFGEHVDFVKQLASIAGKREARFLNDPYCVEELQAPILLSQSAYHWSKSVLQDREGALNGAIHRPQKTRVPGKVRLYPVFPVWPENVGTTTVQEQPLHVRTNRTAAAT